MSIAEEILLKDSASGPARKIASALGALNRELDKLVSTATRVRDFGPDLEKALSTANKAKGAAALADKLTLEDARRASKVAAAEATARAKAQLQDAKLAASDQMAKNKAISALILEQAKGANALAANQNKAAIQTERLASATAKTAASARTISVATTGSSGGGQSRSDSSARDDATSSRLENVAGTLGVIAKTLAVIGGAVAGVTAAFIGASVSAAEWRSNTLAGLKAMLGSKEAAEDMLATIKQFAKESPFSKEEVASSFKSLLGAGFSKEMTQDILSGLFDVSALNNFNRDIISKLTLTISQIKAKGKLQGEELLQLAEGSGGQISIERVNTEIAKSLGKTPAEVQKMISAGAIKSDVAIKAILEVIRTNLSGGKLGALAKELGAQSLQGLGSTLGDFFTDMFEMVDITPLKKLLAGLVEVLGGPAGDKLTAAVTKLGTALFDGLFGGLDKGDKLTSLVNGVADAIAFVADAVEAAAPFLKAMGEGIMEGFGDVGALLKDLFGGKSFDKKPAESLVEVFKNAGKAIAYLVSGVAALAVFIGEGFVFLTGLVTAIVGVISTVASTIFGPILAQINLIRSIFSSDGPSLGAALIDGLVSGITAGISRVASAVTTVAQTAVSAFTSATGIASPSKVFAALGVQLPAGAAVGVTAGTAMLERASTDMAMAGINAAAAPLNDNSAAAPLFGNAAGAGAATGAGAAGGDFNVNISVAVDGSGPDAKETARAIGDELRPVIRSEISRALRRTAA